MNNYRMFPQSAFDPSRIPTPQLGAPPALMPWPQQSGPNLGQALMGGLSQLYQAMQNRDAPPTPGGLKMPQPEVRGNTDSVKFPSFSNRRHPLLGSLGAPPAR